MSKRLLWTNRLLRLPPASKEYRGYPLGSPMGTLALCSPMLALLTLLPFLCLHAGEHTAEQRIIEYLRNNLRPGSPVIISKLHNEVFISPEERKALDRLYNIVFKIPSYVAEYYAASGNLPTRKEIALQFGLSGGDEVEVLLHILEYDNRIPRFFTRDPQSGEILKVEVDKIKSDPRFGKVMDRSLSGWEGKVAPGFILQSLDGKEMDLRDLKDETRLLYFWFTNCPPCIQITPHLVSLQARFKERGFSIVGLNADRVMDLDYSDQERQAYLKEHHINFPVVHLSNEVQAAYGGVQLFPTLFLIDRNGIIRGHFVNYQDEVTLEKAINRLIRQQ
jgi:peroxiredoxin